MGKVYPYFSYFCGPVDIVLPGQKVHVGVWHWMGKLCEWWSSQLVALVVLLLWPVDAAHGGIYWRVKKEIFLLWL